jgi:glutamyl-tRNA synthetase
MSVRTRFAPSPTGFLHLGSLRTALYAWLFARSQGGTFILRIEDTDQKREIAGATETIYRALRRAGIDWDEGPDVGGPFGPYIQSERKALYRPYAEELVERGSAYYCFCPTERLDTLRKKAESEGKAFKYDKRCLDMRQEEIKARLAAGEPYVIRQNIPPAGVGFFDDEILGRIEVDTDTLDDQVLLKSDGMPTYNFANVVDDHLMGVTHILRGSEFVSSTPKYNLLYDAFGWDKPVYIHLPPVMADKNRKLSKRHGDPSFEDLLDEGYLPEAVVNYIALLGWNPGDEREIMSMEELVGAFSLRGISKSPAIFDYDKLRWFNAQYIRALPAARFRDLILPYMEKAVDTARIDTLRLAQLLQPRCETLTEVTEMIGFLAQMPPFDASLYTNKKMKTTPETSLPVLQALLPVLEAVDCWSESAVRDAVTAFIEAEGLKNGPVLWPLRVALSNSMYTPGGAYEIAGLLGREEALQRLRGSIAGLLQSVKRADG